jgi:hypothetical protein
MKMVVTIEVPDQSAPIAVILDETIQGCVRHIRDSACNGVGVHDVRIYTDALYRERMRKLYGPEPKRRSGWVKHMAKV